MYFCAVNTTTRNMPRFERKRSVASITYNYSHYPSAIVRTAKRKGVYNDYTPDGLKLFCRHVSYIPNGNSNIRVVVRDQYIDGLILRDNTPLLWRFNGAV